MQRYLMLTSLFLIMLCMPSASMAGPGDVGPGKGPEVVIHEPELIATDATVVSFYAHSRRPGIDYHFETQYNGESVDIPYDYNVIMNVEGVEDIAVEFDLSNLELTNGSTLTWMFTATDGENTYRAAESTHIKGVQN